MSERDYSHKTLAEKLGVKPGLKIATNHSLDSSYFANFPRDSMLHLSFFMAARDYDIIIFFASDEKILGDNVENLALSIKKGGMVWICWPKKASNVKTDLNENSVREIGLKNKMVDVKVVSVDETWSALKFVYRLTDR